MTCLGRPSHPGYLPSLQDPEAGACVSQGPSTSQLQERCGVQHPMCWMPLTYIGQTGRSLDHRLREHRLTLKNEDLGSSALAEHVFSANHRVDLSKAMIIDTHNHTQTRCMLEFWHIQHHQSPLNRETAPCQDSMLHYWPLSFLFYLAYVMYLVNLAHYLTWPQHHLTALYFNMCACKCQLFTDDEGSCRLPKHVNYCFSVLTSTTNRSP